MYKTMRLPKKLLLCTVLFLILSILFLIVADAMQTEKTYAHLFPELYASAQDKKDAVQKTAYITFDDGPSKVTPAILDALKEANVKATFFVIGRTSEQDVATLRRIHEEGHSIGIHSYSHKYKEIYRSVEAYLEDFSEIEAWIYALTGEHPQIFRFPGGSNNSSAKKSLMVDIATEMTRRGYIYHDWNVIAHDDQKTIYSADQLYQNVVKSAKNKLDRDLTLLFHDNSTRKTTAEALPKVIEYFRSQGYVFEKITPETKPIQFNKPKAEE